MFNDNDMLNFLEQHNYDIRKTHSARWIDQKCTPDVLWSIADFIIQYVDTDHDSFTIKDIWSSEYARETVDETYSKPGTNEKKSENEYDKFFAQPINMLCYADIIENIGKDGRKKLYAVKNREALDYIAKVDMNSLKFICMYVRKVMLDSGLLGRFDDFFEKQDKIAFDNLKNSFIDFYHTYTPVTKEKEPQRVFTKVINPLAYKLKKLGTCQGRLSKKIITKSDLMYNKDNFRDIYENKPKNISRNEWRERNKTSVRTGYFMQQMAHAKEMLRKSIAEYRNNRSELSQFNKDFESDNVMPTQIHHIFPQSDFPEIMHYIENLIALTPNQHYAFAHPSNRTQYVDPVAQKALLIAKTASIEQNLINEEYKIYDFDNLKEVLYVGMKENESIKVIRQNDFKAILHAINVFYGKND